MWLPCGRPPNTSWGHMISAPSSRPAAHPPTPCAHCAEPQCPPTQPAPSSFPRRAGEGGQLARWPGGGGAWAQFQHGPRQGQCGSRTWPARELPRHLWGMLGRSVMPVNLQLCAPPGPGSLPSWGTEHRECCLSLRAARLPQSSLPSGQFLAAAEKVPLGEEHQASGSGPARRGSVLLPQHCPRGLQPHGSC